MFNPFQRIPVYIKIYPDKIEIVNIKTGQALSKVASTSFSSSRMLIAEFNVAENLIRDILNELGLSKRSLKLLIQQMKEFEGGICESEKRILADLGEQAGAVSIQIVNRTQVLSNEEIHAALKIKY